MCSAGKTDEVTAILERWSSGDPEALGELIPLILDDVHRLAQRALAWEAPCHTLQPTALVNEVYLRLAGRRTVTWKNRQQFFGFLTEMLRRILVDHVRAHRRTKRGSGKRPLALDDVFGLRSAMRHPELIALDDALKSLAKRDPRASRIVELRYFIGLTLEQIAEVYGVSLSTVNREWKVARLWLLDALDQRAGD